MPLFTTVEKAIFALDMTRLPVMVLPVFITAKFALSNAATAIAFELIVMVPKAPSDVDIHCVVSPSP